MVLMHQDDWPWLEHTESSMETSVSMELPLWSRVGAAISARMGDLHLNPWSLVALVLGWAVVWSGWGVARAGWVHARQAGLTLSAISATACWLSIVLGFLALRDLLDFNRRWARGEYASARRVPFHPLWLPPAVFVVGLAFGRLVW